MKEPRDWREQDWSWWQPGDTVLYDAIHPDAPVWSLDLDAGRRFDAYDGYCVTPGCECALMTLGFYTTLPESEELIGVAWLKHDTWTVHQLDPEPGWEKETAGLAAVFLANRRAYEALVQDRLREMRELVGPEIVRLAHPPAAPTPKTSGKKTKPNAPCPCGSGKKYKACCM